MIGGKLAIPHKRGAPSIYVTYALQLKDWPNAPAHDKHPGPPPEVQLARSGNTKTKHILQRILGMPELKGNLYLPPGHNKRG